MKTIIKLLIIGLIAFGCKKDPVETDPAKAILGKWECIAIGNGSLLTPISPAKGYIEYTSDSIVRGFEYATMENSYSRFWIDSLLYESQYTDEGKEIIFAKFHFSFSNNNNQLRLDFYPPLAVFNTSIYKRIN